MRRDQPAVLALEDGTIFNGSALGATGTSTGEACFNTGMTGYQEVVTDPSYHGQIVAMTAPQIGNTGVNLEDDQSSHPWVAGFVVRDISPTYSSWRATGSFHDYLERHGVVGITEVDTRRLTRHIRTRGAMRSALSSGDLSSDELVDLARAAPSMSGADLVAGVTTPRPYRWSTSDVDARGLLGSWDGGATGRQISMAAVDFGIKRNILDLLVGTGFDVTVVPARTEAALILAGGFDCVFLSNGPGDPEAVTYGIELVRELVGRIPVFGICLGHQILSLALGARTFKLPFGHRGSNHPVKRLANGKVEITCQNHGFAVDPDSLENTAATVSHVNLNDGTLEGIVVPDIAMSVQYHPEAGPGPHDARYLFAEARTLVDNFQPRDVSVAVTA